VKNSWRRAGWQKSVDTMYGKALVSGYEERVGEEERRDAF
jgi:hypothetical protein